MYSEATYIWDLTHGDKASQVLHLNHQTSLVDGDHLSNDCHILLLQLCNTLPANLLLQDMYPCGPCLLACYSHMPSANLHACKARLDTT